jgi:membrane protein DedA with SNARE-associated domain
VFETLVTWLVDTIFKLGYPGIVLLMALESSFFPFPSEVVLPPAGFLAAQGRMNVWLVVAAGISGSLLGATVNYVVAAKLGRPLLHKYSKYLLIKEQSLDRSEAFFLKHGEISTFVGRLIPVIRQYISLPAGLSRMNLGVFCLFTGLGAGIWSGVLTYIGWFLGKNADVLNNELVGQYTRQAILITLPVLLVVIGGYVVYKRKGAATGE